MTKLMLGWVALIFMATTASAQTKTMQKTSNWRIGSIGLDIGHVHDVYQRMNLDMMYDFTRNSALLDRDLSGLKERLYRESSGNRLGLNVILKRNRPDARFDHEIRLGAFYSNREPMILYDYATPYFDDLSTSTVIYCNVVNEASLEGTYLLRKSFGKNDWFSTYAGLGVFLGGSFNNRLVVMESATDTEGNETLQENNFYAAKSSVFTRAQLPIGIQATVLKKVNFSLETHFGVGMQSVVGGRSYFMPTTTGLRFGVSYNL